MKLYEISDIFAEAFDELESYDSYEPPRNDRGDYIDENGELIEKPDEYIATMRESLKEAWLESLTALEEIFEIKAVNIAMYIKNLDAEAEAMKREKQKLEARQKAKERRSAWLRSYLITSMVKTGRKKIDLPQACISLRLNPESAEVGDEKSFIAWAQSHDRDDLLNYGKPTVAKMAVRQALKDGAEMPECVRLVRTISAVIK